MLRPRVSTSGGQSGGNGAVMAWFWVVVVGEVVVVLEEEEGVAPLGDLPFMRARQSEIETQVRQLMEFLSAY